MSKKVTEQELEESLNYLGAIIKGENPQPIQKEESSVKENPEPKENTDEPEDELYSAHKNRVAYYLDKAMCHKGFMDSIKKGDPLPDEAFDDLEDNNSPEPKEVKKGKEDELGGQASVEDLVKAKVQEELKGTKLEYEGIIKGLKDQIQQLSNEPQPKTLIKGADAVILKKALSGEKVDDKTVISLSLQKSKVSDALFQAAEGEADSLKKGVLMDAVSQFECTGNYVSPEVCQLMESKGIKFIK